MSPLETSTNSPVETPEVPQNPCQYRRGILSSRPRLHTRSLAPALTGEESREAPRNSLGDWPFLRPQEQVPEVPVVTREGPAATRENPGGSSLQPTGGPFPLRRLKANHTFPLELRKHPSHPCCTEDVLRHTRLPREEHRGSHQHHDEPCFRLVDRDECSFPCFVGKRIPSVPVASQVEALPTGKWIGTPGVLPPLIYIKIGWLRTLVGKVDSS